MFTRSIFFSFVLYISPMAAMLPCMVDDEDARIREFYQHTPASASTSTSTSKTKTSARQMLKNLPILPGNESVVFNNHQELESFLAQPLGQRMQVKKFIFAEQEFWITEAYMQKLVVACPWLCLLEFSTFDRKMRAIQHGWAKTLTFHSKEEFVVWLGKPILERIKVQSIKFSVAGCRLDCKEDFTDSDVQKLVDAFPWLEELDLRFVTSVTAGNFAPLSQLEQLKELYLEGSKIQGNALRKIAEKCLQLRRLFLLESYVLNPDDFCCLGQLKNLQILDLSITGISRNAFEDLVCRLSKYTQSILVAVSHCMALNDVFCSDMQKKYPHVCIRADFSQREIWE